MKTRTARTLGCLLAVGSFLPGAAFGADGLAACAGSPDGKWFVAGGFNCAVGIFETGNWTCAKRIYLGAWVRRIDFSHDSSQFAALCQDKALRVYGLKDFSELKKLEGVGAAAYARGAGIAVTDYFDAAKKERGLCVWSVPAWKETKRIPLELKDCAVLLIAVTNGGETAYVRTTQFPKPDEKQAAGAASRPADEPDVVWRARKDGYASRLLTIDLEKGQVVRDTECFDSPSNDVGGIGYMPGLFITGETVITTTYEGTVGILDRKSGAYAVVEARGKSSGRMLGFGVGMGPAGEIYVGSLAQYAVIDARGNTLAELKVPNGTPGFPEYFGGFCTVGDKYVVGVTTKCRMVIIDPKTRDVLKTVTYEQ